MCILGWSLLEIRNKFYQAYSEIELKWVKNDFIKHNFSIECMYFKSVAEDIMILTNIKSL